MSREGTKRLGLRSWGLSYWTIVALVVVLIFSIPSLVWFGRNWYVTPDASQYLLRGWNLISGHGYTILNDVPHTRRGPVLSGLFGLLILVFGRDVDALAWTVRVLALLNPWLAYFVIRRFSGPIAGVLAAALVALFGYAATLPQAFNLDAVLLTVYLLSVLAILAAVKRGSTPLALLSGLLLGATIITKETAFASLPLGLLAALLLGWSPRGLVWHYAGLALVCLPWWVWVWSVSGEVYLVGTVPQALIYPALAAFAGLAVVAALLYRSDVPDRLLGSPRRRRWIAWGLTGVWTLGLSAALVAQSAELPTLSLDGLQSYVTGPLARETPLWPLLILAGAYVVFKAIRGGRLWQFYLLILVLQIPVSLLVLMLGYNPRQYMTPQTFLLGALAVLVVELSRTMLRRPARRDLPVIPIALAVVGFLSVVSVFQVRELSAQPEQRTYYLRDHNNPFVNEMSAWISKNVPVGEDILTTQLYLGQLAFLDGSKHEWTNLDLECERGELAPGASGCVPSEEIFRNPPTPTVWFQIPRRPPKISGNDGQCAAVALSLPGLLRQMERSNSRYLLLTPNWKHSGVLGWAPYLVDSGAFEVSHATPTVRDGATGLPVGLVLLKYTSEPTETLPTRMDAYTVNQLVRCHRQTSGPQFAQEIRNSFPDGISLDTRSVILANSIAQERQNAAARKAIEQIYGSK